MNIPEHWLVIRLSALGDVVLTTGVLQYLHSKYGWRFTFLTLEQWAPVLEQHPAVESVIGISKEDVRSGNEYSFFKQLAAQYAGYGLLDLHGTVRSRLLALYWKGPVRRYPKFSVHRRLFLQTGGRLGADKLLEFNVPQRYSLAVEEHAPSRQELLPVIHLTDEELAYGARLQESAAGTKPVVAIHPFSTHPNKAWVDAYWQELAERCVAQGAHVVVVGLGNSPVQEAEGISDFTNSLSLRNTCSLLAHVSCLVTGDSGPMHLASAVRTPVVALFGPTHRAWGFYPEGVSDCILEADEACRPCSLHGKKLCDKQHVCMQKITPDRVMEQVAFLLR